MGVENRKILAEILSKYGVDVLVFVTHIILTESSIRLKKHPKGAFRSFYKKMALLPSLLRLVLSQFEQPVPFLNFLHRSCIEGKQHFPGKLKKCGTVGRNERIIPHSLLR